jgi:hypothetical protein
LSPPSESAESPEAEEAPTWLSDMPRAPDTGLLSRLREFEETETSEPSKVETEQPTAAPTEPTAETEFEIPGWLSDEETPAEEPPVTPAEPAAEAESEMPAWLLDEETFVESTAETEPEIPWLSDTEATLTEESAIEDESEWPAWLSESDDTIPAKTESEVDEMEELPPGSSESAEIAGDESSSSQDWLSGLRKATEAVEAALPPEEGGQSETQLPPPPPKTNESKPDPDLGGIKASQASAPSQTSVTPQAPATSPTAKSSSWLQALKPAEAATVVEDNQAAESTGVLAGLTGLLPVEKLVTAIPAIEPRPTNGQAEAILEAAQDFYTIATQTPQPATVPTPLTQQRKQLMGGVARAFLYVLFIILVALPLLPGMQRATGPEKGHQSPWTEPGGELNEVLDKQRRLLVSEALGVTLQRPRRVK